MFGQDAHVGVHSGSISGPAKDGVPPWSAVDGRHSALGHHLETDKSG